MKELKLFFIKTFIKEKIFLNIVWDENQNLFLIIIQNFKLFCNLLFIQQTNKLPL